MASSVTVRLGTGGNITGAVNKPSGEFHDSVEDLVEQYKNGVHFLVLSHSASLLTRLPFVVPKMIFRKRYHLMEP